MVDYLNLSLLKWSFFYFYVLSITGPFIDQFIHLLHLLVNTVFRFFVNRTWHITNIIRYIKTFGVGVIPTRPFPQVLGGTGLNSAPRKLFWRPLQEKSR